MGSGTHSSPPSKRVSRLGTGEDEVGVRGDPSVGRHGERFEVGPGSRGPFRFPSFPPEGDTPRRVPKVLESAPVRVL